MRRVIVLVSFLFFVQVSVSQEEKNVESIQIESVIKGYIENFFLNDYDKMEVFLHERLSKRGINQNGKLNKNVSKLDLKEIMSKQREFPLKYQRNKVRDIKIYNRIATAILDTGYPKARWKEYIHLAKLNGKWIVLDVVWCFDEIKD